MQPSLFFIDRISAWVGKAFAWLIVVLTAIMSFDITMRYVFHNATLWAYDMSYTLYGTLFMMGGAYTLSRAAHVRGDIFYRMWPVRAQAAVDLVLYILAFFPGVVALVWYGTQWAQQSIAVNEHSFSSMFAPPIWPLKTVIPVAGFFLVLQGVAETIRCTQALRTGEWPQRLSDVEETETILARQSEV